MNDTLRMLVELQTLDSEIIAKNRIIKSIPEKLSVTDKPLKYAESNVEYRKKMLEDIEKKKKARESELTDVKPRLEKLKARSGEIKDQRMYAAHQKEIDMAEKEIQKGATDIAKFLESISSRAAELKEAEEVLATERQKADDLKATLDIEAKAAKAEISVLKQKRKSLTSAINTDAFDMYMDMLKSKSGLAVAPVDNEICGGCHMNVMPQLIVEVRNNTEIVHCPQCGRILYCTETA